MKKEGKEAERTLNLIPEKEVSINRTEGDGGRTRNQELWALERSQGKALNVCVSPILPHPCMTQSSTLPVGKGTPSFARCFVFSMEVESVRMGLTWNFFIYGNFLVFTRSYEQRKRKMYDGDKIEIDGKKTTRFIAFL